MDFIREHNAFEQWLRTNYLPGGSQLLWYKLFALCNGAGWPEWFVADNYYLMSLICLKNEKSFFGYRDKLVECGLIEYQKGKKGSPNRYKMLPLTKCTYKLQVQTPVKTPVQTPVKTPAKTPVQTTVKPTVIPKRKLKRKQEDEEERPRSGCNGDQIGDANNTIGDFPDPELQELARQRNAALDEIEALWGRVDGGGNGKWSAHDMDMGNMLLDQHPREWVSEAITVAKNTGVCTWQRVGRVIKAFVAQGGPDSTHGRQRTMPQQVENPYYKTLE